MKNIYLIALIVVSIIITSCTNNEKSHSNLIYVNLDSLNSVCSLNENIIERSFLKLGNIPNGRIYGVKSIEIDDTLLFVEDINENVYLFNNNGKYLCQIGAKGSNDSDYIKLLGFFLNSQEKTVNLLDSQKGVILSFDYKGNYLKSTRVPIELLAYCSEINYIGNHNLLFVNYNYSDVKSNYSVYDFDKDICLNLLDYMFTYNQPVQYPCKSKVATVKNNTYLISQCSDTIYSIEDDEIYPVLVYIDPRKHKSIKDNFNSSYDISDDVSQKLFDQGISSGIQSIYATNSHFVFKISEKNTNYIIVYNKLKKNGYKIDLSNSPYSSYFCDFIYSNSKFIVSCSSVEMSKMAADDNDDKLLKKFLNDTESLGENPILTFFHFVK